MRIAASLHREYRRHRAHWRRQGGNIVATSALLMVVLIGVLALVIDIGFLSGQRRFMQNGADAAALVAARKLAGAVSKNPNGSTFPVFFTISHAQVLAAATAIAQQNQNVGLTSRTTSFTVLIDYCVASSPAGYNYNTSTNCRVSVDSDWSTTLTNDGRPRDGTYMVRARVSSTITTFFGRTLGTNATTASARASAAILGACPLTSTGQTWPVTVWDQQDFGVNPSQLFQLWSSNPPGPNGGSWKNLLDFSPSSTWCDGTNPDYAWGQDYKPGNGPNPDQPITTLIPAGVSCTPYPGIPARNFTGTDNTWNRGAYIPDSRGSCYVGDVTSSPTVANWLATFYRGTIAVGMKIPTFENRNPGGSAGDGGANIASGIYGSPSAPTCAGTYFFQNQTAIDPDYPQWGPYRDVLVYTYDVTGPCNQNVNNATNNCYYWTPGQDNWRANGGGGPNRVKLMRILNFRIYRDYTNSNSEIWGRVISPVFPPDTPIGSCSISPGTTGPNIYGNIVRMGQ